MLLADADDKLQFVRDNIARHDYCVIGTTCSDGRPWAVCVKLILNDDFTISWYSRNDTLHSQNIDRDPRVAIHVYSHTDDQGDFGFYADARVTNVSDNPDEPVQGYTATLDAAWVSDDSHKKQVVEL